MGTMKNILASILFVSAILCQTSQGRLRESVAECKARYGEPVSVDNDTAGMEFKKNGFTIIAFFEKGRAVMIVFSRPKSGIITINEGISNDQIATILKGNSASEKWEKKENMDFTGYSWVLSGKNDIARYDTIDKTLCLVTAEKTAAINKEAIDKRKKDVDGF